MPRWPIEDVRLDELDLDLRNVRIPFEGLDEAAIAAYLVESADLLELAGDILRDGYLDNEIACRRRGERPPGSAGRKPADHGPEGHRTILRCSAGLRPGWNA